MEFTVNSTALITAMNAIVRPKAVHPARVMPLRSRAPWARPIRTVTAWLRPNGTMKQIAAIWIARTAARNHSHQFRGLGIRSDG